MFRNSDFYIKCVNGVSRDIFKQGQHNSNLMDANVYGATRRQLQGSTSASPFSGLITSGTSQLTSSGCDYMSFWSQLTTTQKLFFIDPLRAEAVNRDFMQQNAQTGSWSILNPIYYAAPANDMFGYHDLVGAASVEYKKPKSGDNADPKEEMT